MYPIYRCNVLRRGSVLDILIENEASRSISITLPSFRTTLSRLSGSEPTTFYVDGLRPFRDRLQFTFIWLQCGITLHPRRANQPLISTVQLHVLSVFFAQWELLFFSFSRSRGFAEISRIQQFQLDTYLFLAYLFSCDLGRVGVSESIVPPFA